MVSGIWSLKRITPWSSGFHNLISSMWLDSFQARSAKPRESNISRVRHWSPVELVRQMRASNQSSGFNFRLPKRFRDKIHKCNSPSACPLKILEFRLSTIRQSTPHLASQVAIICSQWVSKCSDNFPGRHNTYQPGRACTHDKDIGMINWELSCDRHGVCSVCDQLRCSIWADYVALLFAGADLGASVRVLQL
jgi:hypothetical protein